MNRTQTEKLTHELSDALSAVQNASAKLAKLAQEYEAARKIAQQELVMAHSKASALLTVIKSS